MWNWKATDSWNSMINYVHELLRDGTEIWRLNPSPVNEFYKFMCSIIMCKFSESS